MTGEVSRQVQKMTWDEHMYEHQVQDPEQVSEISLHPIPARLLYGEDIISRADEIVENQ